MTFVSSISLFLELTGSNLAQTQSCMALVIFLRYACKCQKWRLSEQISFHVTIALIPFNSLQQHQTMDSGEIQSKNRQLIIEIVPECH